MISEYLLSYNFTNVLSKREKPLGISTPLPMIAQSNSLDDIFQSPTVSENFTTDDFFTARKSTHKSATK